MARVLNTGYGYDLVSLNEAELNAAAVEEAFRERLHDANPYQSLDPREAAPKLATTIAATG